MLDKKVSLNFWNSSGSAVVEVSVLQVLLFDV